MLPIGFLKSASGRRNRGNERMRAGKPGSGTETEGVRESGTEEERERERERDRDRTNGTCEEDRKEIDSTMCNIAKFEGETT
jgi:hypothetical protein